MFAAPELRADREVVLRAVAQDGFAGFALKFAAPEIRAEVQRAAEELGVEVRQYAGNKIQMIVQLSARLAPPGEPLQVQWWAASRGLGASP